MRNKALTILSITNIIFVLGASMFPPIFALFVQRIGGGVLAASTIWATFAVMTGFFMLFLSRFGDRVKEKEYLIAVGYLFRFAGWLGYFFAGFLWQLYVLQIILALGEALGTPAFSAVYSEHLNKGRYIRQWGVWNSLNFFIVGVSSLLGGIIVAQFNFKILFLIMAFLAAASFFLLIIQPRKLL